LTWVDKRIDSIDDVLSAPKSQHGEALGAAKLGRSLRDGGEEESREQHHEWR
jgi:hypothetical protein